MPAPGDQHRPHQQPPNSTDNPFDPSPRRISTYTAQEIATLSSRLEKQLGPEYISSRPGAAGQKVHYLAAEKVINLANEVFGFNGWSSGIQNVQIDFVDENASTGKISLGLSVIVRVTLRDGTYHEDIGYGHIENCKGKAAAFEKAKKEGTTDALKRALRNFGNVLGNCIYDKEYLARVTKIKVEPSKWTADNLHRHADYAPLVKKEPDDTPPDRRSDDEFGGDDFDEVDFADPPPGNPDEVALPTSLPPNPPQPQPSRTSMTRDQAIALAKARRLQHQPQTPDRPSMQPPPPTTTAVPIPAFYTARAAPLLQSQPTDPTAASASPAAHFNPHAESPSIRKTSGIDHSKSKPVVRDAVVAAAAAAPRAAGPPAAVGSDGAMAARRVGMPPSPMGAGLANRGSYKPPGPAGGSKRALDTGAVVSRPPLGDAGPDAVNRTLIGGGGGGGVKVETAGEKERDGEGDGKRVRLGAS